MKHALFMVFMIDLCAQHECFFIPQPYNVKMYHHASILLTGEEGAEENFTLNFTKSGHDLTVIGDNLQESSDTYIRKKRIATQSKQNVPPAHSYDDAESQDQGSFESSDGSNTTETDHSYDYDYEKFKNEYYLEDGSQNTTNTETSYGEYPEEEEHTTKINLNKAERNNETSAEVPMENYCSVILLFRIRVFECFFYGISKDNQDIKQRSVWVIAFWTILYTITASYLWCTRGWCCCCCPCACCHPHSVIQDAKQFLTQYPPGVAHLHSKRKVLYKSSEYEKDCYKALENEVYNF